MATHAHRSRWRLIWYPVAAIAIMDVLYQLGISWHQAGIIRHARPDLLLLAVANQLAVYMVVVPAMQEFFAAASIRLSAWRCFALIGSGMALAKIIPGGEYILWRTNLHRQRGGVGATTQWLVMYYTWMIAGLLTLFLVSEALTLMIYPDAPAKTLVGNLRFLPIGGSLIFLLGLLATRIKAFRKFVLRLAFEQVGPSRAISPLGIIRERRLSRDTLSAFAFASLASWLIEGFTLYLCLRSVGVVAPAIIVMFGYTFARLFTLLPIVPGGIGQIEAASVLFFVAYGFPLNMVLTAAVMFRLITYWPPLLVGCVSYVAMRGTLSWQAVKRVATRSETYSTR